MDRIGTEFVAHARIEELIAFAASDRLAETRDGRRESQDVSARMRRAVAAFFSHTVSDPSRPFMPKLSDYPAARR